jgi:hypothetical protein
MLSGAFIAVSKQGKKPNNGSKYVRAELRTKVRPYKPQQPVSVIVCVYDRLRESAQPFSER